MSEAHHHHTNQLNVNRAFIIGIVLNALFVIIETVTGLVTHSLALLTDAGHNLSDVASLSLSLLAFRLAKVKSSDTYTYGYQKTTILVALINSVILLIAIGSIGWEALKRIDSPVLVSGKTISIVAGIGIFVNAISAYLFFHDRKSDLNIKGAYLHLAADALVSVGVVIAGIIISYTGFYWVDSVISFVIIIVIFMSTWKLLKETIRLSLDGMPHNVEFENVKESARSIPGITDIHHIHIWAMSTTKNAMTAHLILEKNLSQNQIAKIKSDLKHKLEHLNIQHVTLETEIQNCDDEYCDGKE